LFQSQAARLIENFGVSPVTAQPVGFIVVLVLVESLFSIAGHLALTPIVRAVHRSPALERADRIGGIFPASARALFVIAIVLAAFVVSPVGSDLKASVESSRIARGLIDQISAFQPILAKLSGQLGETVPLFVTKLGEDQREDLDLPSDLQLSADPVAERQMFDLLNDERAAVGLARLQWDDRLLPVARQHSEEMFKLKYFAHQSPVSGSPFDRLKGGGHHVYASRREPGVRAVGLRRAPRSHAEPGAPREHPATRVHAYRDRRRIRRSVRAYVYADVRDAMTGKEEAPTLDDLVANRTMSEDIAATLRATAKGRHSYLVVAIPRFAGKTTVMRAMLAHAPKGIPIQTVEDDGTDVPRLLAASKGRLHRRARDRENDAARVHLGSPGPQGLRGRGRRCVLGDRAPCSQHGGGDGADHERQ
jgi:hypothetical protein